MKRHAGSFIKPTDAVLSPDARDSYVRPEDFNPSRERGVRVPPSVIPRPDVLREDRGMYPTAMPKGQAQDKATGRAHVPFDTQLHPANATYNPYGHQETTQLPVYTPPPEAAAPQATPGYVGMHNQPIEARPVPSGTQFKR